MFTVKNNCDSLDIMIFHVKNNNINILLHVGLFMKPTVSSLTVRDVSNNRIYGMELVAYTAVPGILPFFKTKL